MEEQLILTCFDASDASGVEDSLVLPGAEGHGLVQQDLTEEKQTHEMNKSRGDSSITNYTVTHN